MQKSGVPDSILRKVLQMRFPKPIVYLGFLLIAAAVLGSIYEAVFKEEAKVINDEPSAKEKAAGMIVDKLFEQLKGELAAEGVEVREDIFSYLREHHRTVFVKKYVYIAEELERKKHSEKETQEINGGFNKNTVASLKAIYFGKLNSSKSN